MKHKYRLVNQVLVLTILVTLGVCPLWSRAVGISPALVTTDDILPQSEVTKTFYFSRGDASQAETVVVMIEGEAAEHIAPAQGAFGDLITLPAGESLTPFDIIIRAGDLAEGEYLATITVNPIEADSEAIAGTGSTFLAGARGEIRFTVSNEELEQYNIGNVAVADTEAEIPVAVSYTMNNTGNVATRLGSVEATFIDINDETKSYQAKVEEKDLPIVEAFHGEIISWSTGLALPVGVYHATAKFYSRANELVYELTPPLTFQVYPQGTFRQKVEILELTSDQSNYTTGENSLFTARIINSGELGVSTEVITEIYRDNARVELLKSEAVYLDPDDEQILQMSATLNEAGTYRIVAYAEYNARRSDSAELTITVQSFPLWMVLIALGVLVLLLTVILLICLHRHRRRQCPQPRVLDLKNKVATVKTKKVIRIQ